MDFIRKLFKPTYVTVILKPYQGKKILGFVKNNNFTLTQSIIKNSTLEDILENFNKFRTPNEQIRVCYVDGKRVTPKNIKITKELIVYVDIS